jgi:two-component system response regulator BaeR
MNSAPLRGVLVVEDDAKIARLLIDYLLNEGYEASSVADGRDGLRQIEHSSPDIVILDLMLPGLDGIGVCQAVRRFSDVPILMLTARVDEVDRLLGLDTGADDYVCKPFSPREVMARVRALLRRAEGRVSTSSVPWSVDENAQRIWWVGKLLPLTPLEFRLLKRLVSFPGRVYSREQLQRGVHPDLRDSSDRVIDSHIKNLRRKIQAVDQDCECIVSVYGVGYRLDVPD